jgi:H+-transporting ATPase
MASISDSATSELVERMDGFAAVFPDHKYKVVLALQHSGKKVAMTGDGVNDCQSLRQANVGIAVADASDAARAVVIPLQQP